MALNAAVAGQTGGAKAELVQTGWKVLGAVALFALVHSVLASRPAKQLADQALGTGRRNAFYRPFYIGQSVATSCLLAAYLRRLPDRVLYEARGPVRRLLQLGQLAGLLYAYWAAREVGLARLLGWPGFKAWLSRAPVTAPEPEAQGPAPGSDGLRVAGPFTTSRHPLNFAPLPMLWCMPKMTLKLALFNLGATVYFWAGSYHEARRLRQAYGAAYARYEQAGVPFWVPWKLLSKGSAF